MKFYLLYFVLFLAIDYRKRLTGVFFLHEDGIKTGNMDGYVGFHAALRCAYTRFLKDLAKQCKQLVRHHLDSVTSPYSQVCYFNDFQPCAGINASSFNKFPQASASSFFLELSDTNSASHDVRRDQENIPPEKNALEETTPGKAAHVRESLRESQMTIPETPSPDQPGDPVYGGHRKELGICNDMGPRKRASRMTGNGKNSDYIRLQNDSILFGNGERTGSAYSEICLSAAQHFARIREVLVERGVTSTLNSGFLTPW